MCGGLWCSVESLRCRVSGFGFQVSGFGFRISGFGFRVCGACSRSPAQCQKPPSSAQGVVFRLYSAECVVWGVLCVTDSGEGHKTRKCRRVTYPELYITTYTTNSKIIQGVRCLQSQPRAVPEGTPVFALHPDCQRLFSVSDFWGWPHSVKNEALITPKICVLRAQHCSRNSLKVNLPWASSKVIC